MTRTSNHYDNQKIVNDELFMKSISDEQE